MYIAPNSTIELLYDIPLDNSYIHTLYWNSEIDQSQYFLNHRYTALENYSYVRPERGSIRINLGINEVLLRCNYLRFKNTSFEDKWFYAFITDMEYVSNTVTKISFEIDVMQTWFFDYTVKQCLVVREHSRTDEIGDNIQLENLETGDYIYASSEGIAQSSMIDYAYVVLASQSPEGTNAFDNTSNVFSGLTLNVCNSLEELSNLLQAYKSGVTKSLEPITAIYQVPSFFNTAASAWGRGVGSVDYKLVEPSSDFSVIFNSFRSADGQTSYNPKNKKLFTYPYSFMTLVLPNGTSKVYKYERFADYRNITFKIIGCLMTQPECLFEPINYNGLYNNFVDAVTFNGFPTCAVASDAFSAWWAQNKASYPTGIADNLISKYDERNKIAQHVTDVIQKDLLNQGNGQSYVPADVTSGFSGLDAGWVSQKLNELQMNASAGWALITNIKDMHLDIANELAAKENHKAVPDTVVGNASCGSIFNAINQNIGIVYYNQISAEYAKIIDNYFTMFGYACNELKVPSINNRPIWNYIKTSGCTLNTRIPRQYEDAICKIYDKGITFWKNPSVVGRYDGDNSPA